MKHILKSGKYAKRSKCEKCGCEFTYVDGDVKRATPKHKEGKLGYATKTISCPECDHEILLDWGMV